MEHEVKKNDAAARTFSSSLLRAIIVLFLFLEKPHACPYFLDYALTAMTTAINEA